MSIAPPKAARVVIYRAAAALGASSWEVQAGQRVAASGTFDRQ
jgi:hypothetical protein